MAKKPNAPVQMTLEQIAEHMRQVAVVLGEIESVEHRCQQAKKLLDDAAAKDVAPLKERLFQIAKTIRAYADAHWDELTQGDSIKIPRILESGRLHKFTTPPSITFKKKVQASVIAWLEKRKFEAYLRRKVEVNKEALRRNLEIAKAIPGVTVSYTKKLSIKPVGRRDWIECNLKSGEWTVVEASAEKIGIETEEAA